MTEAPPAQSSSSPIGGLEALRDRLRAREISLLIGGGVALLCLIIVIGAVSAVLGLRAIAAGYARQQSYDAVVQTAASIDENLLRLRVAANEYLATGRPVERTRMLDAAQALASRVDSGSLTLREVGFGEVVEAMRARLDLLRDVIATLGDLRERRSQTSERFVMLGAKALATLDEIGPRAFEFGDFEGSNRALRLRESLLQAQGDVLAWLITRRASSLAAMGERWTELNAATRRLQLTLREQRDREAVAGVRDAIEPQGALLADLDRITQDESNLDRILDQENGLVQALSDQLRARAQQAEAAVAASVNETFGRARQWTILFASLAIGIGLLGVWYAFRRTVRPIRVITKTLDALASGNLDTRVPFTRARNELGQMARAADVFKNAMIEVERSRNVFQTVLDNLPDGVMLFDKDKRWLMWNRQLVSFQRFPPEVAQVGSAAEDILRYQAVRGDFGPGDPEPYVQAGLERMWTPGGVRYHRWAASGRYIEFNFKPLPGGELLAYYRDLTEMKEIEDEVQKARERLQGAIEGLASGFALYDSDDRLVIWNKRFEEFTPGISDFLKVGAKFSDIVQAAADKGQFRDAIGNEEAWLHERLVYHSEPEGYLINQLPDGRWVQLNKRRTAGGDTVSVFTDITEIKQKEQEVTKATELLRDAIESLASGFALYDAEDRLVIWNKRFEEFAPGVSDVIRKGAKFEDIIRTSVERGMIANAIGREEEWIAQRVAYHRLPEGYQINRVPDGRWIQLNKRRTSGGDMVAVFTDITEIKQKEEEVTKATELLQDAIEGLASGFAIYDEQDRLVICNKRYEELTPSIDGFRKPGANFEEMLRAAVAAGQIPEARGREEEWLKFRIRHHRQPNERIVTRVDDGRWVHIEKQVTKANHVVSVFTDVSDMKKTEQAVRDAQDRLQDAVDSLGSGFLLCDSDSRLIVWNEHLNEMLPGLEDVLKVGARFGDLVRVAISRGILRGVDMKSEEWISDRRIDKANAAARLSQTTVETITGRWVQMTRQRSANGNTVAILVDITEMKNREIELDRLVVALEAARDTADKARADAEAANQAKSTFLATMSHEIRTPMNGVLGMLEVIEHGDLAERQRTQVKLARSSATSLLNIIDDVLDFSKIEAGRLELEKVDVDLLSLVEGVAETMTEGARRKGLSLYAEVDPLLPEKIVGDPTRLRQILFNLVGNGIKFTEAGSVSIVAESIARDGDAFMRLTVGDTGIGMTGEQRDRLFTPFEQADATTTRRFGGTGLGLSIVARLVNLMGGTVTAQSAPGHGSVFIVEIPIVSAAKQSARPQVLAGLSIAVAMADTDAAKRLAGHLSQRGASVEILSADLDSGHSANMGLACDMLVAERAAWSAPGAIDRRRGPARHIFLDGWDAKPGDETSRSVGMPWRVESIVAAAASLDGRSFKASASAAFDTSGRWARGAEEVGSDAPGSPAGRAKANGAAPRADRAATAKPSGAEILIVDDHPVNREVIRRQLELLGHATDEADNGSTAFALWQGGRHRLVITDCHMPVLDGFGLTAAIRAAEEGGAHRTPIVALTANALAGESDRCLAAGMDDYLAKPVPLDKLRATIDRWLERAGAGDQAKMNDAADKSEAALDRSVLADLFGDDDATIARLIGTFVETTRASLSDIDHAFGDGNSSTIAEIAHRMKGSARMVGAQKLAQVAESIEKAAKAGDVAAARAHQRSLQSAAEKTFAAAGA
ncbi:PAS-domain containing protein [Terrarubrum flagellatum]|uniref:PAS-domain containing protein n=1 Tax=Terrirubrum flagellatum TaxID=2895980 RepID=UPI0031453AF8